MNDEKNKKRTIANLLNGKHKTITEAVINKYDWTAEELQLIEPYRKHDDNLKVKENPGENDVMLSDIMNIIENIPNENTKKTYRSRANALIDLSGVKNGVFSDIFDDNLPSLIDDKYKDSTGYYGFLLYIIDSCESLKKTVSKKFKTKLKKRFETSKNEQHAIYIESRKEQLNYEKVYKELFEVEKQLRHTDYGSMKHVIAILYSIALYDKNDVIHMNPRNYFLKVRLIDTDDDFSDKENCYNYLNGRLKICCYKTSDLYDPYDIRFNDDVITILKKSIEMNPRTYLIEKVKSGLMKNNSLSEMITRTMGYNIDTIRKSIESYEINVKKQSRLHLAMVSRHTVVTQEISYLSK
jgi:hypothetical protein|tara:strand:+ start:8969 stop:10027 length:1059 start_codon:yes stop_codon:yes gene_type:complete